jgi:WD40 repeat protein
VYATTSIAFTLTNTFPNDETVLRVRLSADGSLLVSRTPIEITVRDASNGAVLRTIPSGGNFALSPDGTVLAAAGNDSTDQTIRIYRLGDGALLRTLVLPNSYAEDVAFTPDGKRLISVGQTQIISWRVANWKRIWTVQGDDDAVRTVVISPDGKTFATTNQTANVKLWRVHDAQLLQTFPNQGWGGELVAYSPDSQFLATGGLDPLVSVWQVDTGQLVTQLDVAPFGATSVAYRRTSDLLAVGTGDGSILLWSVPDYTLQQTLTGHTNGVNSLVFTQDGQTLFSASGDTTINRWQQIP